MIVYQIDQNGAYIGPHECQPCPVTGGWLYPSYYTETPPPDHEQFKKAVYINNQWSMVDTDYGKDIYHKESKLKSVCYDDKVPVEYTLIPPVENKPCTWQDDNWVVDFNQYKEDKKLKINRDFENNLSEGRFNSSVIGIEVDCRRGGMKNDLQNVEGLIDDYDSLQEEEKYYVGVSEITDFPLTLQQLKLLKVEMIRYVKDLYKKKWAIESQIPAASTIEELDDIKWI